MQSAASSSSPASSPASSFSPLAATLLYEDGEWINLDDDPIDERFLLGLPLPVVIGDLGYTLFTTVRHQDTAPLGMSLYRGPLTVGLRWIVVLEAPACAEGQGPQYTYVYARRIADVMDLLGRWAPVIHALAAAELAALNLSEAEDETSEGLSNLVRQAAAAVSAASSDVFRLTEDGPVGGAPAPAAPDPQASTAPHTDDTPAPPAR